MADPLNQQPQRNYLDDILDQAYNDLQIEQERQDNILNAPDPAKRLGEIQRIEKQVVNEVPEIQKAVTQNAYRDTSYFTGRPFSSQQPQKQPVQQPLVKPGLQPGETNQWKGFLNAIKSGYKQGQLARNVIKMEGGLDAENRLKEIASLQAEIRGIPRSKAYNEFNKAETFGKALKTLAVDPVEITSQLVAESMASFLPTQIAGAMTGAGIGAGVGSIVPGLGTLAGATSGALYGGITSAGLTSLGLEYSGKMLEVMGELGVNVEDPDDLARGFSDQKIMSEARELGLRKGVPIAIFDLVSAGVAGRFMKPGKSLASKAIQGSKEVGTQAVLGSAGEATGQVSAGEEIQPSAIIAEGIAEIGQSAPSGATRLATQKFKQDRIRNARAKGLDALETGQLKQLSNQDISNFVKAVTKDEAMELGISQETGEIEPQSDLGKEVIRRNLEMEKFPETEAEFREATARANIKEQQIEGKDFVGKMIEKAQEESGVTIEREYLDRTLADEVEQEELSNDRVAEILNEHGLEETLDPKEIMVTGRTSGHVVRLSTAGTEQRLADEFVAVNEEMAEVYYNAESSNIGEQEFEAIISEDRKNFYEATGETSKGESNKEWFSSVAVRFATQGNVHESIGARLKDVFNRFIAQARKLLKDSFQLRKAIREGKVSDSLISKLEEATDFKTVGQKVEQAKLSKSKRDPDGGASYRVTEVGEVNPTGVFLIGADMVARDLDGKLDPFGLRYTENYNGFALSKAGATKLVNRGKEGFNTVAVIAYDQIKGSQEANPSFQNRVKEELAKSVGKRRVNKLLKDNDNDVKKVAGIVNKEIQEFNQKKPKAKKKPKINLTQIALDNAEPDAPQLRRKIVYVGTLKEIRTGKDRFRKHEVYPAEQIFDNLVELKEPIPIDNLIEELPESDMRKKNWGMMVTQTNFLMTTDESKIAKELVEMAQTGKDVFTGTPNPDFQFFSRETEDTTPEQAVQRAGGERQFKARQFVSQLDEELGLGTATRSTVGFTEEYGDEPALVSRFFGKQDKDLLTYRGALAGLMFDQIDVTNFIGSEDGPHSLLKITIDQTDLIDLKQVMQNNGIPNKTIRIRGNQQDILLWDMGDINNKLVNAIADKYNAKEYTKQKGEFQFLTNESDRKEARKRFIGIIQDYQSKTKTGIPKAVSKFLPDFYKRKADRERLLKQLKAKPKPSYRLSSTDDVLKSPSFKKWFKGSQLIDNDGNPMVVYHGTNKSRREMANIYTEGNDFSIFDSNQEISWFGNTEIANEYAFGPFMSREGSIYPVYLNVKNPKVFTEKIVAEETVTKVQAEKILGVDLSQTNFSDNVPIPFYQVINDSETVRQLKEQGYDSVAIEEQDFFKRKTFATIGVFEPTQIKSVFNKGTFNPQDPRISFRLSPENLVTPLAELYQNQKGSKKEYTKQDFEIDLVQLGYPEDAIKTAMDLFGIIRIKQIATDDPTPVEKELKKIQDMNITRSNLKNRIIRAYRLGAVEKEKEIAKLQKIVTKYARENLPRGIYSKSEVTGLLAKVRDAKRAKQMLEALERINRVVDKVNKRTALAKWNKTIKKKAKIKKVNGIPRGQVGADVQDIVSEINKVYKLSVADAESKIELLMEMIDNNGEPTDQQSLDLNILMTYGAIKDKNTEDIARATEQFDSLVEQGRMQVLEDREAYKTRMKEISDQILDIITGGAGPQTQAGIQQLKPKEMGAIREALSEIDNRSQSMEYLFDKLSRLDKTSKPLQSLINQYFMPQIRQAKLAEFNGMREMTTLLKDKASEIYKLKGRKLKNRINQNNIDTITLRHNDGKIGDIKGPMITSELTYNQAYKKWMELQDPTLHPTFEKMGWDVMKTQRQIEEQLPKEVLDWAKWQLNEFYPMYYQRVNKVFRQRFYVNLPFNPVYSPIKRSIGSKGDEGDPTFDKKKTPFGSVQNGSLKSRVSNVEELLWVDGDTIMLQHITEMEHFIAYTNVMRELRTVFSNRNISRSIVDFHGKPISRVLNKFMDDLARGGIDRSQSVGFLDVLRANFSRAVIGLNPVVFLKQLASIPAYASDIPIADWTKNFFSLANPIEARKMLKTLSKSNMLDMRYEAGMERDIALAMRQIKPGNRLTGTDLLNNVAYALTKFGDKTAIYMGGYPLYKYEYKKAIKAGKTKAEAEAIAMKKFESSTLRAQQSGELEDLSDIQRGGSFAKLFTMFMTSPNQYYRMWMSGYRNLMAGRGTRSENVRKIFIAQFVLPSLFTWIANGFEYDEEDQILSLVLSPFYGIMFFGQAIETIVQTLGGKRYGKAGEISILDPFNDANKSLGRMRQIYLGKKDLDTENTWYIINNFLLAITKALGLPYAGIKRTFFGAIKVAKGEAEKPVREAIGFTFDEKKSKKQSQKKVVIQPKINY